ncbi:unnamed protein product [Protopolystoma xenopodis]|uniref:Uncharacterized protein n=1 Tax=Protopolystoma xenopodis TaxID=117903 RepID=A0A448WLE3_9PLAT|nr:unnamed protein product [Protopolystoma xenopodis]
MCAFGAQPLQVSPTPLGRTRTGQPKSRPSEGHSCRAVEVTSQFERRCEDQDGVALGFFAIFSQLGELFSGLKVSMATSAPFTTAAEPFLVESLSQFTLTSHLRPEPAYLQLDPSQCQEPMLGTLAQQLVADETPANLSTSHFRIDHSEGRYCQRLQHQVQVKSSSNAFI